MEVGLAGIHYLPFVLPSYSYIFIAATHRCRRMQCIPLDCEEFKSRIKCYKAEKEKQPVSFSNCTKPIAATFRLLIALPLI